MAKLDDRKKLRATDNIPKGGIVMGVGYSRTQVGVSAIIVIGILLVGTGLFLFVIEMPVDPGNTTTTTTTTTTTSPTTTSPPPRLPRVEPDGAWLRAFQRQLRISVES